MKRKLLTALLAVFLAVIALIVLFLSGSIFWAEDFQENARMKTVVSAINAQDAKKLKRLFSFNALEECDEIDSQIMDLFDFLEGDITSWKMDSYHSSEENSSGKKRLTAHPVFIAETDNEEYEIYFMDVRIDDFDRRNKGIYMIEVCKTSYDGEWEEWEVRKRAGISIVQ